MKVYTNETVHTGVIVYTIETVHTGVIVYTIDVKGNFSKRKQKLKGKK